MKKAIRYGLALFAVMFSVALGRIPFVAAAQAAPQIVLDGNIGTYVQDTVQFSGKATYAGGIDRVGVYIDGINVWDQTTETGRTADGCTESFSYNKDVTTLHTGIHVVTLVAFAKDGQQSAVQFCITKAEPILHVDSAQAAGYSPYSDIKVSGWAVNATGIQAVMVNIDGKGSWYNATANQAGQDHSAGGAYKGGNSADFTYTIPKGTISLGTHVILVAARGNDGQTIFAYQMVEIKPTGTQLVVDSNLSNTYFRDTLQFTGYCAGDDTIQSVCVNFDWVPAWYPTTKVDRTDVSGAYGFSFNDPAANQAVKNLSVGDHAVTVAAIGQSKTYFYSFIMKKKAQTLSVDTPANGSSGNYDVTINGSADNPAGISNTCVDVNGSGWQMMSQASSFSFKIPTSYLHEGTNVVLIAAVGNDGQRTYDVRQFNCSVPLVLQPSADLNNKYLNSQTQVTGYAANPTGINTVCYDFDGRGKWASANLQQRDRLGGYPDGSTVNFSLNLDTLTLTPGNHVLALAAVGNDGRTSFLYYIVHCAGSTTVTHYNTTLGTVENSKINDYTTMLKDDSACYEGPETKDNWYYLTYQGDQKGYAELIPPDQTYGPFHSDANTYNMLFSKLAWFANPASFYNYNSNVFKDSISPYMFMSLKYVDGVSADGLNQFLAGGILQGCGQKMIDAGNKYNVNPIYLTMHAVEETTLHGIPGNSYQARTKFNFWGLGAYDSNTGHATTYTSVDQGINDGVYTIAESYVNTKSGGYADTTTMRDEDTLYKMLFDPEWFGIPDYLKAQSPGRLHQYCTDVQWAHNIANYIAEYYQEGYSSDPVTFDVPSYN